MPCLLNERARPMAFLRSQVGLADWQITGIAEGFEIELTNAQREAFARLQSGPPESSSAPV